MKQIDIHDGYIYIPISIASAATSLIFTGEQNNILFDCGDGTLTALLKKRIHNINEIFISHDHIDHIGGLLSLLAYLKIRGIFPKIYHPKDSFVIKLIKEYFASRYHEQFFEFKEMIPEKNLEFSWGNVLPHKAKHFSRSYFLNALCFEIKFLGNSIFYSGDTGSFEELGNYIKNKDVAFIEATFTGHKKRMEEFHLSIMKAKELGKLANRFFLIHREEKHDKSRR